LTQVSNWRCIAPTALARIQLRSHSIDELKIAIPAPSFPNKFSAGTSQSVRIISPMGEVRKPILSRLLLTVKPDVPFVTRKAQAPDKPLPGLIVAKTITTSATGALVMYSLDPLRT